MSIELEAHDLHWIKGDKDDPGDYCAHGRVSFRINETVFVEPDRRWTLSASALYLLRTLEDSHAHSDDVTQGNYLFPCCGFNVFPTTRGKYKLFIIGCPNGIDVHIILQDDLVIVQSLNGKSEIVSFLEWMDAVFGFADQIMAFYQNSSPKEQYHDEDDRIGWTEFWKEWDYRRNKSYSTVGG